MPDCAKWLSLKTALVLLVSAILFGCERPQQDYGFAVNEVESNWQNGTMQVSLQQKLTLSREARNALVHGVPLNLRLELILRDTRGQTHVSTEIRDYEIRFLPLSNHYQLSEPGMDNTRTFPRLRHLLANLSSLNLSLQTGAVPAGDYEILARSSLDLQKMPPPMRLPMLFSSEWRHDSEWSAWPVEIRPQA